MMMDDVRKKQTQRFHERICCCKNLRDATLLWGQHKQMAVMACQRISLHSNVSRFIACILFLLLVKPVASLECRITLDDTMYIDSNQVDHLAIRTSYSIEKISCIPIISKDQNDGEIYEDYDMYDVDLPTDLVQKNLPAIHSGTLFVSISDATVDKVQGKVISMPTSVVTVFAEDGISANHWHKRSRHLQDYTNAHGTRRYAIVRINTSDASPGPTVAELRARYTHPTQGMEANYRDCSAGKLNWVLHDIFDIYLPGSLATYGAAPRQLRDAAIERLRTQLGTSVFPPAQIDNMLFCMPPGTGSWVANAGTGHWASTYNSEWALSLTAVVHELGHNLGLGHSNEQGAAYDDLTGMMGSALNSATGPKKCFNAAHHAALGWFNDKTLSYSTATEGMRIQVAAFVDYTRATTYQPVIVEWGGTYFAQYNRAKAHNAQTEEYPDKLVLIQQLESSTELIAALDLGESTTIRTNNQNVNIQVCSKSNDQVDTIEIGVGTASNPCVYALYGGENVVATSAPTKAPTKPPTNAPTKAPTTAPTKTPTKPPTNAPTKAPTTAPTKAPTNAPTEAPTERPTWKPTRLPTAEPTVEPTKLPTSSPTIRPTPSPTKTPTESPSVLPTPSLTSEPTPLPTNLPSARASTGIPTKGPVLLPTGDPTFYPTSSLGGEDGGYETMEPTRALTFSPTFSNPKRQHTVEPFFRPTHEPSNTPFVAEPTITPSIGTFMDEPTDEPDMISPPTAEPSVMPLTEYPSFAPTVGRNDVFVSSPTSTSDEAIPTEIPSQGGSTAEPSQIQHTDESPQPTFESKDSGNQVDKLTGESVEVSADGSLSSEEYRAVQAEDEDDYVLRKWEKVALKTTWFEYLI